MSDICTHILLQGSVSTLLLRTKFYLAKKAVFLQIFSLRAFLTSNYRDRGLVSIRLVLINIFLAATQILVVELARRPLPSNSTIVI